MVHTLSGRSWMQRENIIASRYTVVSSIEFLVKSEVAGRISRGRVDVSTEEIFFGHRKEIN